MVYSWIEFIKSMVERLRPRSGTIRARVLEHLEAKTPRHLIPEAANLARSQVSNTIPQLYGRYFDKPSEEEINRQRRESISASWRSKPGTKVNIVFDKLRQEVPRERIPEITGLTMRVVGRAVAQLRRTKRVDKLSPDEQRKQMIASIRTAKNSIWPYIGEYAEMGLPSRQIQVATRIKKGSVFTIKRIGYIAGKARHRAHHLPSRSEVEKAYVRSVNYMSPEEVEQETRLILEVKNLLAEHNLHRAPQRLSDWLLLVDFYKRRTNKTEMSEETVARLRVCLEALEKQTKLEQLLILARKVPQEKDRPTLLEFYQKHKRPMPKDNIEFLEAYYAARLCSNSANGYRGALEGSIQVILHDVTEVFDAVDPDIYERVSEEVAFIRDNTRVQNNNHISQEALAVHSEISRGEATGHESEI